MELISIGFLLGVIFSIIVFGGGVVYGYYFGDLGNVKLHDSIDNISNTGDYDIEFSKTARPGRQNKEKN